jgi:uncharacterized membrane protein
MTSPEVDGEERIEDVPDRLITLSDGIYAIAMTLLVLDINVPGGLDSARFHAAIAAVWPKLAAYAWSFYILTTFWRDHRRVFLRVRRIDPTLLRLTAGSLGAAALLPFTTSLLAEYSRQAVAVALYAGNILAIVSLHMALVLTLWRRRHLQAHQISDEVGRSVIQHLSVTAAVFALSIPVAFVSPLAGLCCWILLIPAKIAVGWRTRRIDT